jgi:hypothetical protein
MTIDSKRAADDLAFMRALVEDHGTGNRSFGINYLAAGILYGVQCFTNGLLLVTATEAPTFVWLTIGFLPTILFLIVNFYTIWKERSHPFGTGTTKRALNAAFAGAGIANLILALIFGWAAYQKSDWSIWLLFPIVVAALQGAIWFTVAVLRRRIWQGLTAIGWFISAFCLGFLINEPYKYVLVLGVVLLLCMALPGFIMLRSETHHTPRA